MRTQTLPRAYTLPPKRVGLLTRLSAMRMIWRSRTALNDLDAHLLNDIGLTESEARREAKRPIWDVPVRWLR